MLVEPTPWPMLHCGGGIAKCTLFPVGVAGSVASLEGGETPTEATANQTRLGFSLQALKMPTTTMVETLALLFPMQQAFQCRRREIPSVSWGRRF